jgi:hypothetical protein
MNKINKTVKIFYRMKNGSDDVQSVQQLPQLSEVFLIDGSQRRIVDDAGRMIERKQHEPMGQRSGSGRRSVM